MSSGFQPQKPKYKVYSEAEPSIFSDTTSEIDLPPTMRMPPTDAPTFVDSLPLPPTPIIGGGAPTVAADPYELPSILKKSSSLATSCGDSKTTSIPNRMPVPVQTPQRGASGAPAPSMTAVPAPDFTSNDFADVVRTYVAKHNPKLYILTPCYGCMCYIDYMTCLIQTIEYFRSVNFPLQVEFCKNDSLVSRARNNLVARAMTDPECTHIMFIDSDIIWSPIDILKLVLSEKELCGGIYPLKHYHWGKLLGGSGAPNAPSPVPPYQNVVQNWIDKKNASQLRNYVSDEDTIKYNLVRYNVNYVSNYLHIENNMAEVRHIATGFMLIQRCVLEKMFRSFPTTKYIDDVCFLKPHENANAYALFDCGVENETGTEPHYYSEDWLFCHRYRKMSSEHKIYIDVSIALGHCGSEVYHGSFINSII